MYEAKHQRLATKDIFLRRMLRSLFLGIITVGVSLGLGILGYHHFEEMSWIEAFENASMILSGMGPVSELKTDAGKIFAGVYALFSGVVFLVIIGVVGAPLFHRFLHRFHIEEAKMKS
jgi:hypothetical protein